MKATELMIGDLVSLTKTGDIAPCVVTALHPKEVFVLQPEWSAGEVFSYDTIYAIPLTPEILEKNGFEIEEGLIYDSMTLVVSDKCVWWNKEYGMSITKYPNKNNVYVPFICIPSLVYVHELQHALRLCGLNDLADNFKV